MTPWLLTLTLVAAPHALDREALVDRLRAERRVETKTGELFEDFAVRFDDQGLLRYLSGPGLASGCYLKAPAGATQARDFAGCVMEKLPALFHVDGSATNAKTLVATNVDKLSGGYTVLRFEQRVDGVLVDGSETLLTLLEGELLQFSGRLYPKSRLPEKAPGFNAKKWDIKQLRKASGQELLGFVERRFDPDDGRFVAVYATSGGEVYIDEAKAKVTRERSRVAHASLEEMTTTAAQYDNRVRWPEISSSSQQTLQRIVDLEVLHHDFGSYCTASFDMASLNPGYQVKYDSSGVGTGGAPWVTGASCTPGDWLDSYPMSVLSGRMTNLAFWMRDLHEFSLSADAGYFDEYAWTALDTLEIAATPGLPSRCGGARGCAGRSHSFFVPGNLELTSQSHFIAIGHPGVDDPQLWAHEYGHYLHYMYDHGAEDECGAEQLIEGFGDHNVLRYALYRMRQDASRSWDQLEFPDGYDTTFETPMLNLVRYRHEERASNGLYRPHENIPDLGTWSIQQLDAVVYNDHSSVCSNCSGNNEYLCGSVMSQVYWTLAWNEIRTSYRSRLSGSPILTTSSHASQPEWPANVAYTFAIRSTADSANIEDFFGAVSSRYYGFWGAGEINLTEYWNVHTAMNVHCLGWSNHCDSGAYHMVAWHPLPEALTRFSTFATDDEQYMQSELFFTQNGATEVDFGNPYDSASYIRLDSANENAWTLINFPESGLYSFHAAVRPQSTGADSMRLQIDGQTPILWDVEDDFGDWIWSHSGPTIFIEAGIHSVNLIYREPMDIDSLLVRRE